MIQHDEASIFRDCLGGMYCYFYALAHLPRTDAMLFSYAAPVFTPLPAKPRGKRVAARARAPISEYATPWSAANQCPRPQLGRRPP